VGVKDWSPCHFIISDVLCFVLLLLVSQVKALRKLFLSHTVQHVYTDTEIKDMVKKSIGLDKSKVTEYR